MVLNPDEQQPKNGPFLISPVDDINMHHAKLNNVKQHWKSTAPLVTASHQDKVNWIASTENNHALDPDPDKLYDANDALKVVIFESCPDPIEVQLVARADKLPELGVPNLGLSSIHGELKPPHFGNGNLQNDVNDVDAANNAIKIHKSPDNVAVALPDAGAPIADNAADVAAAVSATVNPTETPMEGVVESSRSDDPLAATAVPATLDTAAIMHVETQPQNPVPIQDDVTMQPKSDVLGNTQSDNPAGVHVDIKTSEVTGQVKVEIVNEMKPAEQQSDKPDEQLTAADIVDSIKPVDEMLPDPLALVEAPKSPPPQPQQQSIAYEAQQPKIEPIVSHLGAEKSIDSNPVPHPGATEQCVPKLESAPLPSEQQPKDSDPRYFLLTQKIVSRNTRVSALVPELLRAAGLPEDVHVRCAVPQNSFSTTPRYLLDMPNIVGEAVCFPKDSQNDTFAVAFEVISKENTLQPYERYLQQLARENADSGAAYLLVSKEASTSADDTVTPTASAETHDVLWYRQCEEFERCRAHIRTGQGEADSIRRRLTKGDVDTQDLVLYMIQAEVNHVKRISGENRWKRKLASLLALTIELHRNPGFITQCTNPPDAVKVVQEISDHWRMSILKHGAHTDEELGLNAPISTVVGPQSAPGDSRKALCAFLKKIQSGIESFTVPTDNGSLKVAFSCVPGKPRVRTPQPPGTIPLAIPQGTALVPAPRGRSPHDSAGLPMQWDGSAALWRSTSNPEETRIAKTKTPRSSMATTVEPIHPAMPIAPNQSGSIQQPVSATMDVNSQQPELPVVEPLAVNLAVADATQPAAALTASSANVGLKPRPGGRPPHDSNGQSMQWDASSGMWRSANNPEETRPAPTPKKNVSTVQQMQVQPQSVPMQVVTTDGQPVQPVQENSNMQEAATTDATGNTLVPLHQFAIEPRSHTPTTKTPRKRPAPDQGSSAFGTGGAVMYTPPPRGRAPLDSQGDSMSWDGTAGLWRSNRLPTETKVSNARSTRSPHSRPGGRTPHDSKGKPMMWDGEKALWVSTQDPTETKQSNAKAPRASPVALEQPVVAAIQGAEPVVAPAVPQVPQAYPKPGGRTPHDNQGTPMTWDHAEGVWRSVNNPEEIKHPGKKLAQNTELSPNDEGGTVTLRPGGRAPRDSKGDEMEWDGHMAVWKSLSNPYETRVPNVRKWAYEGQSSNPDDEEDEMLEEQEVGDDVIVAPIDSNGAPVAEGEVPVEDQVPADVEDVRMEEVERIAESVPLGDPEAPMEAVVEQIPTENEVEAPAANTTPKPGGRRPHDSTGHPMDWDPVAAVWKSTKVPNETRQPRIKTPRSSLSPNEIPGQPVSGDEVKTEEEPGKMVAGEEGGPQQPQGTPTENVVLNQVSSVNSMRPVGRPPNDKSGKPMVWDVGHGCYRSTVDLHETRVPKPRSSTTSAQGNQPAEPVAPAPPEPAAAPPAEPVYGTLEVVPSVEVTENKDKPEPAPEIRATETKEAEAKPAEAVLEAEPVKADVATEAGATDDATPAATPSGTANGDAVIVTPKDAVPHPEVPQPEANVAVVAPVQSAAVAVTSAEGEAAETR